MTESLDGKEPSELNRTVDDLHQQQQDAQPVNGRPYSYVFTPWPNESRGFPPALFQLFRALSCSVQDDFTEAEFALFRQQLAECGITLREISRIPYHEHEAVL